MEIILKSQEQSTNSLFNGQLVTTRNFVNTFENKAYMLALKTVIKIQNERVSTEEGADYLQVCEYKGIAYWVIDNGNIVTVLLPEDY